MTQPLPTGSPPLAALLALMGPGAVFVLNGAPEICVISHGLETLGPSVLRAPDDWLAQAAFHDIVSKSPLAGAQRPLTPLPADRLVHSTIAGWMNDAGDERVLRLTRRQTQDGSYALLIAEDLTHAYWTQGDKDPARPVLADDMALLAHDLANVLGTTQMAADALLQTALAPAHRTKLDDILRASQRGFSIIDALRGQNYAPPNADIIMDAAKELRATAQLVARVMPETITFDVSIPDTPIFVQCDRAAFEAAILHLVRAARRAVMTQVAQSGHIVLSLTRVDGFVDIRVGTSQWLLGDRTEAAIEDAGLTQLRDLARHHGGTVRIAPYDADAPHIVLRLPASLATVSDDGTALSGRRLVLVEHDPEVSHHMAVSLRALSAQVTEISSPQAFDAAMAAPPDVVIVGARFASGAPTAPTLDALSRRPAMPRFVYLVDRMLSPSGLDGPPGLRLCKPISLSSLRNAIALSLGPDRE